MTPQRMTGLHVTRWGRIAFTSTRSGKSAGIYVMDAVDGQTVKKLLRLEWLHIGHLMVRR